MKVNIGKVIEEKLRESPYSIARFAREIGHDRKFVYESIFKKKSIDTDLLCRICDLLNYDFFNLYKDDEDM